MLRLNPLDIGKKVLITGGAGFIGFHLSKRLLSKGVTVIGFDNMNDYYDVRLKYDRMKALREYDSYSFVKGDLADKGSVEDLFKASEPDIVVNLGAQAGVRYSIENPRAYVDSNVCGFFNVLEACRDSDKLFGKRVEHLLYASSSSVYGNQQKTPYSVSDNTNCLISLYAATKKSNELMAFTYSHLYNIPVTGVRFFTVYGPFGRPDMAYFSFTKNIIEGKAIEVFNNGDMYRDFTYIDDIVQGVENMLCNPPQVDGAQGARAKLYNIGNNKPEKLMYFIEVLERIIEKEAKKEFLPMQPGDVYQTYADIGDLARDFGFKPSTGIEEGLEKFVEWYKGYYCIGS